VIAVIARDRKGKAALFIYLEDPANGYRVLQFSKHETAGIMSNLRADHPISRRGLTA